MLLSDSDRLHSQEQVAAVAARLGHGLAELASDIRSVIEAAVPTPRDIPTSLLEASVQQNIDALLSILANDIDPTGVTPPVAAVEVARRFAQRGVSTFALIRAYRIGYAQFLRRLIADLVAHNGATSEGQATLEMVQRVTDYVDRIVEDLIGTYAKARDEWLNPNAILMARVHSVLNEQGIDVDTAQSRLATYTVRQNHLGIEIWVHGSTGDSVPVLRAAIDVAAKAMHTPERPLFIPLDDASACCWIPLGTNTSVDAELLAAAASSSPSVYAAYGEPAAGLAGFRRTHQQAMSAAAVARVNDPPLERFTPYIDVAPIAAMGSDLASARAWVSETLGDLAIDDERHAGFRETARVFFATGGSYTATAQQLHLHRNTAQYRLNQAEEIRGRPFRDDRLNVELALLACHWFGPAVLQAIPTG